MNDMAPIAVAVAVGVVAVPLLVNHIDKVERGERATQTLEIMARETGRKIDGPSSLPPEVIAKIDADRASRAAEVVVAEARRKADAETVMVLREKAAEDAESDRRQAQLKAEIDNAYRRQGSQAFWQERRAANQATYNRARQRNAQYFENLRHNLELRAQERVAVEQARQYTIRRQQEPHIVFVQRFAKPHATRTGH